MIDNNKIEPVGKSVGKALPGEDLYHTLNEIYHTELLSQLKRVVGRSMLVCF